MHFVSIWYQYKIFKSLEMVYVSWSFQKKIINSYQALPKPINEDLETAVYGCNTQLFEKMFFLYLKANLKTCLV